MKVFSQIYRASMLFVMALLSACSPQSAPTPAGEQFSITPKWEQGAPAGSSFRTASAQTQNSASTENVEAKLEDLSKQWWYGPGVGETMLNVGTAVVFPPYAIYVLGNAGLKYAGLNPLYVTNALPEEPREKVLYVYDSVASVPGRVNATLGDEQFRDSEQP